MPDVFSIGHSTRAFEAFLEALQAHGIVRVADIRAMPWSRRHPHFGQKRLEPALGAAGIVYRWMPALGGRREAPADPAPFAAWREPAFRAYAAYMETPEFEAAVAELADWAGEVPTAFLCAERDWHQCHRQLVADALHARGWCVTHVVDAERAEPHAPPPFARFENGRVVYDAGMPELFDRRSRSRGVKR